MSETWTATRNAWVHPESEPAYRHDCGKCVFLGPFACGGTTYDLYWCGQRGYPTALARYGDGGPNYVSGTVFATGRACPELAEAYRRAAARGLQLEPTSG